MSPLLEVSLLIVFLLWVIPVLSITHISMRALAIGIKRQLGSSRVQEDEYSRLAEESIRPKHEEWKRLDGELRDLRMKVAKGLATEKRLEWQVFKEEALSSPNRDTLAALRDQWELEKNQNGVYRQRLASIERDSRLAFAEFQVAISTNRVTAASNRAQGLLMNEAVESFQRLESKISQQEVQLYGGSAFEDRYVNFPKIAKSIAKLSLELLEKKDLVLLLDVVRHASDDMERTIKQGAIYEDCMRKEMESYAQKAISCLKDFEAAEVSRDKFAAEVAWKRRCDYCASAEQFKVLLQASEVCTEELNQMREYLKEKDKEISEFVSE